MVTDVCVVGLAQRQCGAWDCVNGFLLDLDRMKEDQVSGYLRQRHAYFFGDDGPPGVPLPLLRLKVGYFLQHLGFERAGRLALSPEFLQNYRAAMDHNPDGFTPEMRELLALDGAPTPSRELGGPVANDEPGRHGCLCRCGKPRDFRMRLCADCRRERRKGTFKRANLKRRSRTSRGLSKMTPQKVPQPAYGGGRRVVRGEMGVDHQGA